MEALRAQMGEMASESRVCCISNEIAYQRPKSPSSQRQHHAGQNRRGACSGSEQHPVGEPEKAGMAGPDDPPQLAGGHPC